MDIRPAFKKLLIAAIAVYVIGVSLMLADLYHKVISIEHMLIEIPGANLHKH